MSGSQPFAAPRTLETARLRLRRPALADAEAVFAYTGDPLVTRFMDWRTHRSADDAADFLRGCAPRWESGEELCWLLTLPPDDLAVGTIACRVRSGEAGFGFLLRRDLWGRGLATEAARAVADWATGPLGVRRLWATCDVENHGSARVLEKAGLTFERLLPGFAVRPNLSPAPRDARLYSLVRARP